MIKAKFIDRGLHQRIENWSELDEDQKRELRHLGFRGLPDFLAKAEKLANEQLLAHGLPIDWPTPAPLFPGTRDESQFMGWDMPDVCKPEALCNSHPNAEMAAKLKLDVYRCREFIDAAEFRSTPLPPTGKAVVKGWSPKQNCSEYMFFGVVVALAYWALLANVQFEAAVSEKRRRKEHASALSDDDYRRAISEEDTFAAAAARLGVNVRQIRNRIPKAEREQIRQERTRKS